jgi:hypothetical protein
VTNREIAEIIFNALADKGFKSYNVSYGDSYFIFQGEPDSVVHFRLKGVNKHWKFGMWLKAEELDKEEDPESKEEPTYIVRFFCQWDRNIDKFKPSASSLLVEIEKDYFDKILIDVKAVCDGFYYYGCDFDKNRIINIRHDSQAYMAGLRDGDKIVAINGYKIVNNTMLGRVMACKAVTFETENGKVVTLEGVYFSPEEVRARYLGY